MAKVAAKKKDAELQEVIAIKAPNLKVIRLKVRGTSPYVQHAFGQKAIAAIRAKHEAGSTGRSKRGPKEARDFDNDFKEAMHISEDGWCGIPANGFRAAMVSACRTVGYKMTVAKLSVFVEADGYDKNDGTPLVKMQAGEPEKHMAYVRNETGVVDLRCRPMWRKWEATLSIRYDADSFDAKDIANLVHRVGQQVGIGEGRNDSKKSVGMGWGEFEIVGEEG